MPAGTLPMEVQSPQISDVRVSMMFLGIHPGFSGNLKQVLDTWRGGYSWE